MKKIIALIVVICTMMVGFCANAEGIDMTAMTDAELWNIIEQARIELRNRESDNVTDANIFYEDENIKITLTSDPYIEYGVLTIDAIVENNTDKNLIISVENCQVNGWDVFGPVFSVSGNGKSKYPLEIYGIEEDTDIVDIADFKDMSGTIYYFDEDTFETIRETEKLHWMFGE